VSESDAEVLLVESLELELDPLLRLLLRGGPSLAIP
jgi:hypothetical protein